MFVQKALQIDTQTERHTYRQQMERPGNNTKVSTTIDRNTQTAENYKIFIRIDLMHFERKFKIGLKAENNF